MEEFENSGGGGGGTGGGGSGGGGCKGGGWGFMCDIGGTGGELSRQIGFC